MQRNEFPRAQGAHAVPPPAAHPGEEDDHGGEHIHLPPPSIWPVTTAFGVALGGLGLVSLWQISILGLIFMFWGIINWIQELRHESH